MKKLFPLFVLFLSPLMFSNVVFAELESSPAVVVMPQSEAAKSAVSAEQDFRKRLRKRFPNIDLSNVIKAPVTGLYEVVIGAKVYYFSADARYMLEADIVDMDTRINITRPRQYQARLQALAAIDEKNMLIFAAEKEKYKVTVFTDIDCGYCRKMHSEIKKYNKLGITIRYLFYPRAGKDSPSYKKAVSVWCAKDRKKAFTDAKIGKPIEAKTCKHPIDSHMDLVRQMEMTGTPALLFTNGRIILSYIPPKELLKVLEQKIN